MLIFNSANLMQKSSEALLLTVMKKSDVIVFEYFIKLMITYNFILFIIIFICLRISKIS